MHESWIITPSPRPKTLPPNLHDKNTTADDSDDSDDGNAHNLNHNHNTALALTLACAPRPAPNCLPPPKTTRLRPSLSTSFWASSCLSP